MRIYNYRPASWGCLGFARATAGRGENRSRRKAISVLGSTESRFLKIVESWQGECERVAARAEGCRKVSRKCRGSYKNRANHRKTSSTPKSRKQIIQTYQRGSSWKWYMKTWVVCHWRSLIIILDQSKAFFWATARSHLFRNLYPRAMRSEMQSRLDRPSFASHPRCFILLLLINLWCTIMIYHPWSLIILYHPSSMIAR